MGILNALGLMTRAEHDKAVLRIESERDDWKAKFSASVKDLAAQADVNSVLQSNANLDREAIEKQSKCIAGLRAEIARLKPLAEATERRRANDAKRVRPSRAKAKAASDTVKTGGPKSSAKPAAKKASGK